MSFPREPDAITGNNTYQIVYAGNSSSRRLRLLDVAMDGAEATPEKTQKTDKAHKDYIKVSK